MYEDKTLICKECGEEFIFTAGEQEFYAEKGFENEPQRCKPCRDARKHAARAGREKYEAVCATCGGIATVLFKPREDRPVYCSECFAKMKESEEAKLEEAQSEEAQLEEAQSEEAQSEEAQLEEAQLEEAQSEEA
ncbi:MAG: hypothetical protein GX241_02320 [Ruminococcaceae bacterium]|nr:hypothetical protein [Oscillospiraceae bacterium]